MPAETADNCLCANLETPAAPKIEHYCELVLPEEGRNLCEYKNGEFSELKKMFYVFSQLQSRIVRVSSFQETINIGLNRQKIVQINRVFVI